VDSVSPWPSVPIFAASVIRDAALAARFVHVLVGAAWQTWPAT